MVDDNAIARYLIWSNTFRLPLYRPRTKHLEVLTNSEPANQPLFTSVPHWFVAWVAWIRQNDSPCFRFVVDRSTLVVY